MSMRTICSFKIPTKLYVPIFMGVMSQFFIHFCYANSFLEGETEFGGHSSGIIRALESDGHYVYVGAENGLFQILGNHVVVFDESNSELKDGYISGLFNENKQYLWIAVHGGGVFRLNKYRNIIQRVELNSSNAKSVWKLHVTNDYLITSIVGGIQIFNKSNGKLIKEILQFEGAPLTNVWSFSEFEGKLYISSGQGIFELDIKSKKFTYSEVNQYLNPQIPPTSLKAYANMLYVGNLSGVVAIDTVSDTVKRFTFYKSDDHTQSSVDEFYKDSKGRIWLAAGALFYLDDQNQLIKEAEWRSPTSEAKRSETVTAITETYEGNLLIASSQLGLVNFKNKNSYLLYLHNEKGAFLSEFYDVYRDASDKLVVQTARGSALLDEKTARVDLNRNLLRNSCVEKVLVLLHTNSASTDLEALCKTDIELIGEYTDGNALLLERSGKQSQYFVVSTLGIVDVFKAPDFSLFGVFSSKKDLFTVTANGEIYVQNSKVLWRRLKKGVVKNTAVTCMFEDEIGDIWLCSTGRGLVHLNTNTFDISYIDSSLTGDSSFIRAASIIKNGSFLVATNKGLSVFNRINQSSVEIRSADGVADHDFEYNGIYDLGSNMLVRGDKYSYLIEKNELLSFVERKEQDFLNVSIVSYKIGFSTKDEERTIYSPSSIKQINITDGNVTTVMFSFAINRLIQEAETRIQYRLLGLSDDWKTITGSVGTVSYNALREGDYEFQLRAQSNAEEFKQPLTSLTLNIAPPFLHSDRASYLIWAVTLLLLSYIVLWQRKAIATISKTLVTSMFSKLLAPKNEDESIISVLKHRQKLVSNLSHEIRNPLNLIIGPLSMIKEYPEDGKNEDRLNTVVHNARRLKCLVSQLLSLERFEVSRTMNPVLYDFSEGIAPLTSTLETMVETGGHELKCKVPNSGRITLIEDSLEQIVLNLVSNAVKYTIEPGVIKVLFEVQNDHLILHVIDSGMGMDSDNVENIFVRFTRLDEASKQEGVGIGLALVHELVVANGGWIEVKSELQKGSHFKVTFPNFETSPLLVNEDENADSDELTKEDILNSLSRHGPDVPIIFSIDDNGDMRDHLFDVITKKYRCVTAKGKRQAIIALRVVKPALFIVDLVLDNQDGLELLKQLRDKFNLHHIPVMVLTAKGDRSSQERVLQSQVDEFLVKPVAPSELLLRIENILKIRSATIAHYEKSVANPVNINELDLELPEFKCEKDQAFYIQFLSIIEENYKLESFNRSAAASALAVSERQLNRKLSGLIEHNFAEFLKRYRLKKAKISLLKGEKVSDVAYEVGFGNPSYFSICFKQVFGLSPKFYQEQEYSEPEQSS